MHAKELRTPEERNRYRFALVFSIVAWIALVVSIVGVIYAALGVVVVLIGHALFLAHVRGNGVRIGPEQMPELWDRVNAAAKKLGLETTPETYVLQAGGALNAFATRLFTRNFVIVFSDLIDACEAANPSLGQPNDKPTELDFVIAHELGHIACGHLKWLILPARIVPLLGPAYSRACEYTCDLCGDVVADNPEVSMRALSILASGGRLGARLNVTAFAEQRKATGNFWMAVYELNASHPYLCKRVARVREKHQPGSAPAIGRNVLAYPLAPAFSIFGGGPAGAALSMVIVIIIIMAAVAAPAFKKYADAAKAARAVQENSYYTDDGAAEEGEAEAEAEAQRASVFISGEEFPWRMRLPDRSWQVVSDAIAKKQNPMADKWITRRDVDAHVMVIAEKVEGTHALSEYLPTIINNAKRASSNYAILEKTQITVPGGEGVILHTKARMSEFDLEYLTGVRLEDGYLVQIIGFAESKVFDQVRSQFANAIESFEVLTEEDSQ